MKSLSDVETHQGSIALVDRPRFADDWLSQKDAFILILDGLQDPGNVGTLFRTAEAAGVSGVLLTRGCADPLSPKALRASAGSAFRLPHVLDLSVDALLERLPRGLTLAAAVVGPGSVSVFDAPLGLPLALALGSEGSGLDPRVEAASTHRVVVPNARKVESLNVAAAGAIVMFEIARRAGLLRS
jgi:TrmH family RNA methyltransferase